MKALVLLFIVGVLALFVGLTGNKRAIYYTVLVGLLGALGFTIADWFAPTFSLTNMLSFDRFSLAFSGVGLLATLLLVMLSSYGFRHLHETFGDHYALLLFSLCGAICMTSFTHMVMLFLGLEILSIPLYVLAGAQRDNPASNEAAFKYYLMGAFASGILLFGITLVYGATAHFDLAGIAAAVKNGGATQSGIFNVGLLLIILGMSFKVSAVPFHFWAPDVYEGSPTLITAFMATVVKVAAIAAFYRLFVGAFSAVTFWVGILAVISGLTMIWGNALALVQNNIKRMLAYSSISHTGYMLLGILAIPVVANADGALFFYVLSYALATICVFAVYILVNEQTGRTDFAAFNGMGKRQPFLAIVMCIAMLSLAGIPPLAGFFGKYFLFVNAFSSHPFLVVIAVINSAVSIYYYFRIIVAMYFADEPSELPATTAPLSIFTNYTFVAAMGVILLVVMCTMPGLLTSLVR